MGTAIIQYDEVEHITDSAVLLIIDAVEVWIPSSVIEDDDLPTVHGGPGAVEVAEWFAMKEGLI